LLSAILNYHPKRTILTKSNRILFPLHATL
jgi:hypothetical protein